MACHPLGSDLPRNQFKYLFADQSLSIPVYPQVERLVAEVSEHLEAGAEVQMDDAGPADDDIVCLSSEEDAMAAAAKAPHRKMQEQGKVVKASVFLRLFGVRFAA